MGELRAAVYARASSDRLPIAHQLAALRAQVADDEGPGARGAGVRRRRPLKRSKEIGRAHV